MLVCFFFPKHKVICSELYRDFQSITVTMIPSSLFDYTDCVINNKPISFGCLDPIALKQKDGTVKFIPCRHCIACRLKRMFNLSSSSTYEILGSASVAFITLTYRNSDIPRAWFVVSDDKSHIDFCDDSGVILSEERYTKNFEQQLNKISRNYADRFPNYFRLGQVPYLKRKDITNYLKRIRISSVRQGFDPKVFPIRFLSCGEYGESFARPHFHILLYFQSKSQYLSLKEVLHSKWKFGHVYCRKFTGKGSSYLSSYTVGSSANSYFYGSSFAKQFCGHSNRLGFESYENFSKDASAISVFKRFYKYGSQFTSDGQITLAPPYNYKSSLFQKPRNPCFSYDWFSISNNLQAVRGTLPFERLKLTFLRMLPLHERVCDYAKYILSHKDCIYFHIFGFECLKLNYDNLYSRVYSDCYKSFKFLSLCDKYKVDSLPRATIFRAWHDALICNTIGLFVGYANNVLKSKMLSPDASYFFNNKPKIYFESNFKNSLEFQSYYEYCSQLANKYDKRKKVKHLYSLKDYE